MIRLLSLLVCLGFPATALADVRCIQEFLSETAFDPGPVDGAWGRQTSAALNGFLAQVGLDADPEDRGKICDLMRGSDAEVYKLIAAYRRYPVEIELDTLQALLDRPLFDFSQVDIATEEYSTCVFFIRRHVQHDGRYEDMVGGQITIEGGVISFGRHTWLTRGFADESYLSEEASLVVDRNGQVHGTMPYFHMFISAGEIAQPPVQVTLSREHRPVEGVFPKGVSIFNVDTWQDGVFEIRSCRRTM
jgi:hypothetical protein